MKKLMMFCAAVIAVCATGHAQTVDRITVHFSTPVMIHERILPAGDCSIQVLRGSSDNIVLELRSASQASDAVLVLANRLTNLDAPSDGHATVVLSRHANGYQLDQVLLPDHTGFQVLD